MRFIWASLTIGVTALVAAVTLGAARFMGDDSEAGFSPTASAAPQNGPAVTQANVEFFQRRVEADPFDFTSYTKLGDALMAQARETSDTTAYDRAEAAYRSALGIFPDHLDARAGLAGALIARHDFAGALREAEAVLVADPGATQAIAIIGDAHIALGKYEQGEAAYDQLAVSESGPAINSRLAHLAELRGDTDLAIELMRSAAADSLTGNRSAESRAWYHAQLGTLYFTSGQYDSAKVAYEQSFDLLPGYNLALAGLGSVAAAAGNYEAAIVWYQQAAAAQHPEQIAFLGDLYTAVGDDAAARAQYDAADSIVGRIANDATYDREAVLYLADRGLRTGDAAKLALKDLELRKDVYAYDTAAWALYSADRTDEAALLIQRALALGTQDARLLFHAGMIARADGRLEAAERHLTQALGINPHFSLLYQDEARSVLSELRSELAAER